MKTGAAQEVVREIIRDIRSVVVVDEWFLEVVLTGVLSGGHVLLEDVPGTGKTLTARSLASALGLSFNRIQFTPDLLPADITGSYVFNEQDREFEYEPGPVFANVVLADELNRATPKTQAALLEAMEEEQVSVGGETHELPEPFFVIATQNPIEQEGTFELPEAQRDRFVVKSSMGYPDFEGEQSLLDRRADRSRATPTVGQTISREQFSELLEVPETVTVDGKVRDYVIELCRTSREMEQVDVGVSPRGVQRLFEAARAYALVQGRDFVAPDDVKRVAKPVMVHRLVLTAEASIRRIDKASVVDRILERVEVPAMSAAAED